MNIDLRQAEYIQQAIDEFDTNPLAADFMRKMLNAEPDLFCEVAIRNLDSNGRSNAHRFLATILAQRDDLPDRLTSPGFGTRESAVRLFRRFHEVDPSFDMRLARYGNEADEFNSVHISRALDLLDRTALGTRLLRVLSPLTGSADPRIAAKATLFIGRRLQNPAWTRAQLKRKDQRIRANAVEALWGAHSLPAIHLFEQCASDENNRVIGNSLVGLYLAGSDEALGEVMALSRSEKGGYRSTAAWAMGKLGTPLFRPRLGELLRDRQPSVRSSALRAMMALRRPELNPIETVATSEASDPPEQIETLVEKALEEILPPGIMPPRELRLDGSRVSTTASC